MSLHLLTLFWNHKNGINKWFSPIIWKAPYLWDSVCILIESLGKIGLAAAVTHYTLVGQKFKKKIEVFYWVHFKKVYDFGSYQPNLGNQVANKWYKID